MILINLDIFNKIGSTQRKEWTQNIDVMFKTIYFFKAIIKWLLQLSN